MKKTKGRSKGWCFSIGAASASAECSLREAISSLHAGRATQARAHMSKAMDQVERLAKVDSSEPAKDLLRGAVALFTELEGKVETWRAVEKAERLMGTFQKISKRAKASCNRL